MTQVVFEGRKWRREKLREIPRGRRRRGASVLPKPRSLAAGPRSVRGAEAGTAACEVRDNWIRQAAAAARDASRAVSRALEEPVLRQARVRTESRAGQRKSEPAPPGRSRGTGGGGASLFVCDDYVCMSGYPVHAHGRHARAHTHTRAHAHTHTLTPVFVLAEEPTSLSGTN